MNLSRNKMFTNDKGEFELNLMYALTEILLLSILGLIQTGNSLP